MVRKARKTVRHGRSYHIRASPEMIRTINLIKKECMIRGKPIPTTRDITDLMAKKFTKEELYNEFYIRF